MPNIGVKQTGAAIRRVVPHQTMGVINILAFIEIFYLRGISFDSEFKELIVWFFPKKNMLGGAFSVNKRVFGELKEVVYTEQSVVYSVQGAAVLTGNESSVRVEVSDGNLVVEDTGGSFQDDEDNNKELTGSVCFTVKMEPKKFPNWVQYRNGMLTLRLKNGQEYQFQCGQ